jgi:hypothetical protein
MADNSENRNPRLNRDWHRSHPMPPKATLEQRYAWHLDHERHCACRPMPEKLRRQMEPEQP